MLSSRRLRIRKEYLKQRLMTYSLIGVIGLIILSFVFSFLVFAWYARDLPAPGKLSQVIGSSTIFYDRDGKVLYELSKDKSRIPVKLEDMPKDLQKATIAIEDKNFYRHKGISQQGIFRAIFATLFRGRLEGGSTITQQLIKNVLLDSRRSISRKVREMILAIAIEKKYTKDQIFEMYLNEAPYGGTFYGVGSASKGYFDKAPKDISLVESAFLAGLPQSPTNYSPFIGKKDAWKGRTKDVLRRMREDGYISRKKEREALAKIDTLKFSSVKQSVNAPHFVFYIKEELEKEYGAKFFEQGLKIKTTLSADVQNEVEKVVREEIKKVKGFNVGNGAAVVIDSKTGEILAMVGSYDYNDREYGSFNAALGLRQPGSALKPITYGLAFEKGYTLSTIIVDVKTVFPKQGETDYTPVNYDDKFRGPIQIRFALGNSINIPAVKMLAMVGVKDFLQKANDAGLSTLAPTRENLNRFGLSITLGGGEVTLLDLTSAYSVFARGGVRKDPQAIMEIRNRRNRLLYKQRRVPEKRVFSQEVSFLISHVLSDNNARIDIFGPSSYLNIPGKTVAVKTGTTNDKKDNWAVGYTKGVTVGVWVGNNDNTPMNPKIASGVTGASPIWNRIMTYSLKKYESGIPDKPNKVKALIIDAYLGGLPKDGRPTRSEYFIEGTEPKDVSPFYKKLKISKANGKLANDVEIKTGNYEEKDFIVITESDPISTDGKNRWQEAIDAWAKEQSDDKFKYPTETSDASSDSIVVSIKSPSDRAKLDSNSVNIKAKITSLAAIKSVKIYINGSETKSYNEDKKEIDETINLSDGVYELKITAENDKGKSTESTIKFGVNEDVDD